MIQLLINYDESLYNHTKLCHKYYMFLFISEGIDVILSLFPCLYIIFTRNNLETPSVWYNNWIQSEYR